MYDVIDRVDEKRRRRASESVFKTAAQDQVLVNKALPTIMNKESMGRLNALKPSLGTFVTGPSLEGKKAKLMYRVEPEYKDPTLKDNRYDSKYIPEGGVNIVSPMLSMKYNLSKDNIKM